jgi:hypothetical protein
MDTLGHTCSLMSNQVLKATSGHRLIMQADGNLVLYNAANQPTWASNTSGKPFTHCCMQSDGNLVIYNMAQPVWATNTSGSGGEKIILQTDGNLVIYAPGTRPVWASNTQGR